MRRAMTRFLTPATGAFGLGLLMALGQVPYSIWPLGLGALIGLTWLVARAKTPLAAARCAWAGGAGHFALSLSWIVEPFLVDIARHGWMAPFALGAMAGGLALFWGAAGAVAVWAGRGPRGRALIFAVAMAGVELARGYVLTGFPWALVGHIWIGTPLMQVAAFVGQYGLTLFTTLAAALPLVLPIGPLRAVGAALSLAILSLVWLGGHIREVRPLPPAPDAPVVRLVQPNAAQHLKWREDMIPIFWDRALAFTADGTDPAPDLVVWPETSVPVLLNWADTAFATISEAAGGRPAVVGIQRHGEGGVYNSLAVVGPGGVATDVYDKHHLVPFGEYIPFAPLLGRFGIKGLAAEDVFGYASGPGPQVLNLGDRLGNVLPLICYEAVFPQDLRAGSRPDWLLQITNDAWFGTRTGPYQHLGLARLRAVEQGLAMVRSANTGVSAVIGPTGMVTASLGLGTAGVLTAPLPPALPETVYSKTGDWPVAVLILLAFSVLVAGRFRNSD
ncbi:Apolipoprotein N-acyltransferase [Rhodovulum sp. P5]|nr:Apolipoprotein N-acyltransferase [Rhodovulum sp. P5]